MDIIRYIHVAILFTVSLSADIEILGKDSDGALQDAIRFGAHGWIFNDVSKPFVLRCQIVGTAGIDTLKWLKSPDDTELVGDTQDIAGEKVYLEHTFAYADAGVYKCKHIKGVEEQYKSYTIYAAGVTVAAASVDALAGAAVTLTCSFKSPGIAGDILVNQWRASWKKPDNADVWEEGDIENEDGKLVSKFGAKDGASAKDTGTFTCTWAVTSIYWYTNLGPWDSPINPSVDVVLSVPNLIITHTPDPVPKYPLAGAALTVICTCTNTQEICDGVNMDGATTDGWSVDKKIFTLDTTFSTSATTITCSSTNSAVNGLSASLTIPFALSLEIDPDDYTKYFVAKGQDYKLTCTLSGFPTDYDFDGNTADLPKLVIAKGGTKVEGLTQQVKGTNELELLAPVDTGTAGDTVFTCDMEAPYKLSSPKTVTVTTVGLVEELKAQYIVGEGVKASLTVKIPSTMSSRLPKVSWNKAAAAEMVAEGDNYKSTKDFGATDSPVSATVTYDADRANKEAIMDGFIITSTGTGIIKELFISAPSTATGGTVSITCTIKAAAKTEYVVSIYKGNTLLKTVGRITVNERDMNAEQTALVKTAQITAAEKDDEGMYKCSIVVDGNTGVSKDLEITIGTFVAPVSNEYWLEGIAKSAKLACRVEASTDSDYTIEWYKGVSKLDHGKDGFTITTELIGGKSWRSYLQKSSVVEADKGDYECRIGEAKQQISVTVAGVKLSKNKVYLTTDTWTTATGIVCSVKAPDVNKFTVEWKNSEGGVVAGSTATYTDPDINNELKALISVTNDPAGAYQCTVSHKDAALGSTVNGVTKSATVSLLKPGADSVQYYVLPPQLTCLYTLTPTDGLVTVNYQFTDKDDKQLQTGTEATYTLIKPSGDVTTKCVVTLETASVTQTLVAKERGVGVTDNGVRHVYAGSVAKITCNLKALDSEVGDFTPVWTKGAIPSWTTVTKDEYIDMDLQTKELMIKSDSAGGSSNTIKVILYTADDEVAGGIDIVFAAQPTYKLHQCSTAPAKFADSLPETTGDKIFTMSRTTESFKVEVLNIVLNIVFSDTCDEAAWSDTWSKDVMKIKFSTDDTASDSYSTYPPAPAWQPVTRSIMIAWDLENTPLQIRVNSNDGSGERVFVHLYNQQDEEAGIIVLRFDSPPMYALAPCTGYQPLAGLPADLEKVFTITRTSVGVRLECNDKEIFNIVLSATCDHSAWETAWNRNVAKIQFSSSDTASDDYRVPPGPYPIEASKYTAFAATAATNDEILESFLTLSPEDPGSYRCQLASLETTTFTDLGVYEVIQPSGADLVKFWSGTEKVTIAYEVAKPTGDVVPIVVSNGLADQVMNCGTGQCLYSADVTRTGGSPDIKDVVAQIKLTGAAVLGGVETISGDVTVKIYTRKLSGLDQKVLVTGQTVSLTCVAVAEDTAKFKWMKDTDVITDTAVEGDYDTEKKCRTSTVAVEIVDKADLMKYACTLPSDPTLAEVKLVDIRVSGPVKITAETVVVNEGSPLTLYCAATVIDDDVVTTATLMVGDKAASGFTLAGSYDRQLKTLVAEEFGISQAGDYKCSMKYAYSGKDATSESDLLAITVKEWESSTDYMDKDVGMTLSVSFSGTIDTNSVAWYDEESKKTYTVQTNPSDKKRNTAKIVIAEVGGKTTLTVPPGGLTSTTSFKVKAAVAGKEEIKRKRIQIYEPVFSSKVLFDNGTIQASQGFIQIPVSDYKGVPAVTTQPEAFYHVANAHGEKIQVRVWPKTMDKDVLAIKITIALNDESTNVNTVTFSKVGIKTDPALSEEEEERIVYYKKGMKDDDKTVTAISCTFEADTALGTTVLGSRIEGSDGSVKKTMGEGEKKISLTHGELSEPAKDETDLYTCVLEVEYESSSREYTRLFKVQLKTSKTNAGAIAAAVIIAVLIIAIIVAFFVYRSRRNRSSNQVKLRTPSSPVQETALSGPAPENHPKFNDAVDFLDKIQVRFTEQPDIYQTFLNTLSDFRSKKIVRADLVRKVGVLFEGHADLIEGFGHFLSSKKRAAAPDNQYTAIDLQGNSGGGEIYVNPVAEKRV